MSKRWVLFFPQGKIESGEKKKYIIIRDLIVTITEKLEALEWGAYLSKFSILYL